MITFHDLALIRLENGDPIKLKHKKIQYSQFLSNTFPEYKKEKKFNSICATE